MLRFSDDQTTGTLREWHLSQSDIYCQQLKNSGALKGQSLSQEQLRQDTQARIEPAFDEVGLRSPDDVLGFLKLRHTVGPRFHRVTRVRLHLEENAETAPEGCRILFMLAQFPASGLLWPVGI